MKKLSRIRFFDFQSHNRKSKACPEPSRRIQNRKLAGLSAIAFLLVVSGAVVQAQQPQKIRRIGVLSLTSAATIPDRLNAFRQGLRELGYVDGKNIDIEYRYGDGKMDRVPLLAAELVRLNVEVILTGGSAATRPAKEATA